MISSRKILFVLLIATISWGCTKQYTPKPYGYYRIDIPDTAYTTFQESNYPYRFNVSKNAEIIAKNDLSANDKYWIDIAYPQFNANIHCSYKQINHNFDDLTAESQKFVYKHAQMASAIPEQGFENIEKNVYGVLYEIQGNTASPFQFVLTDSINHFFRGALYFNSTPNQDSLAPVVDYMRYDIRELIESFEWK